MLSAAALLSCSPLTAAKPHTVTRSLHTISPLAQPSRSDAGASTATLRLGWLPDRGKECIRRGPNRGFCAGPRRVPKPFGQAAELARQLGLGVRSSSARLLLAPPARAWVHAAQLAEASDWMWPVDPKGFVRGLGDIRAAIRRRRAMAMPHADPAVVHPAHHEHEGVDLAAPEGTPIQAARSGLVVYSDNEIRGYGNLVILVHPDASVTLYAHCRATFVFPGQRISAGQVIAEVGRTGFARGPHLHFEYRVAGMPRDPLPLLRRSRMRKRALARRRAAGAQAALDRTHGARAHHSE